MKTFCWRGVDTDIEIGETSSCARQDAGVGGGISFAESFVAELSLLSIEGLNSEIESIVWLVMKAHLVREPTHTPKWHV